MQATNDPQTLTLSSGEVYFDQFVDDTFTTEGEQYFGNTPETNITITPTVLDHIDSDHGVNEKDDSETIKVERKGTIKTDSVSVDNVARWFSGDKSSLTQLALTDQDETITVKRGRYYQLGVSDANPTGFRNITFNSATIGVTVVTATGNYTVDEALGRIYIEEAAADIDDGDDVIFNFDVAGSVRSQVISKGKEIKGALRFIAFNQRGIKQDYFMPYVKLTSNGDFTLKTGDKWQEMGFNLEILKMAGREALYIDGRPA